MFALDQLFGGGWTCDTVKRLAGWKAKQVPTKGTMPLWVIGRAGKPGAVSVLVMGGTPELGISAKLDIALYDEDTGPVVYKRLSTGERLVADAYKTETLPTCSGWFLKYIDAEGNLLP